MTRVKAQQLSSAAGGGLKGGTMMETDYARLAYQSRQHFLRYRRRVESMAHKLICQECGGGGGWVEPVLDYGQGPFETCGWCLGTGYVTPWQRGLWLRTRRKH